MLFSDKTGMSIGRRNGFVLDDNLTRQATLSRSACLGEGQLSKNTGLSLRNTMDGTDSIATNPHRLPCNKFVTYNLVYDIM